MPEMRAKLTVESITKDRYHERLVLTALYSDNKEDNTYSDATPSARMEMVISNKNLHGKFNPGDQFYVDFTRINK